MVIEEIFFETGLDFLQSEQEQKIIRFSQEELCRYLSDIPTLLPEINNVIFEYRKEELRFDGYRVFYSDGKLTIRAGQARGILHGVYELLRQLGYDFLFPGRQRQKFRDRGVSLWGLDFKREPWIEYRGMCLYNTTRETLSETLDAVDWMAKNGFNFLLTSIHRFDDTGQGGHAILWDEIGDVLLPELQKRGIVIDMSEHSTDYFFPRWKLFTEHPEWFALKEGRRMPLQICYSNPKAVEAYGDSLAAFAADKPWFKFMGVWPLDGGDYCECEDCRDRLTIYRASVRIAEKIRQVRPDLTVEHLAYTPQSFARPNKTVPENMSALVCSVRNEAAYEWACVTKKSGGAFYFDYSTGDHYRLCAALRLNPHYCREVVNTMASYGYRGIVSLYLPVTSWWQAGINYWYLRRFYYEPDATVENLTMELAELMFGTEKKEAMAGILLLIFQRLQDRDLWSSLEQGHEGYCRHVMNRNVRLDALHKKQFGDVWEAVSQRMERLDAPEDPNGRRQFDLLREYLKLLRLYYERIDTYNAETDTPDKAEAYLEELKACELVEDNPFISEKYARWRIKGRDNILVPGRENAYQAVESRE